MDISGNDYREGHMRDNATPDELREIVRVQADRIAELERNNESLTIRLTTAIRDNRRLLERASVAEQKLAAALEALLSLRDAQNGPPLLSPRHRQAWESAMAAAKAVLDSAATQERTVVAEQQLSAAVAAERDACAAIADGLSVDPTWLGDPSMGLTCAGRKIAAAIRARATPPACNESKEI